MMITWYVVPQYPWCYWFVGPGSKPVPLTEENETTGNSFRIRKIDFAEGDSVVVIGGVWKDTVGVIQSINDNKQSAYNQCRPVRP